jgi:hypothetical protein
MRLLTIFAFLLGATLLETFGDATVRIGLYDRAGLARLGTLLGGGVLLFLYGVLLNRAPVPFERVIGLYLAMLFCVWQVVSIASSRTWPSPPVLIGGLLIVAGGLVVTLWPMPNA